jgi:chromosomal replication initiation ATPase DnaA
MSAKHFFKNLQDYLVDYDFSETDEKKISSMFDRYRETITVKEVVTRPVIIQKPVYQDKVETVYVDIRTSKRIGRNQKSRIVYANKGQIDTIIEQACELWGVDIVDLCSENKKIPLPWARFYCFLRLDEIGCTQMDIGRIFRRDHTTVIHGIRKAKDLIETGHEPFSSIWNRSTHGPDTCDKCGKLL